MSKIFKFKKIINLFLILVVFAVFFVLPLFKLYKELQKLNAESRVINTQVEIDELLNNLENEIKNFMMQ